MPLAINELIQVSVAFQGKTIKPRAFIWQGHYYEIDQVNLIHKSKLGEVLLWHFAVATRGGALAQLVFNTASLQWSLAEFQPQ